jgi:acetoin utilization deacetylase AcuC-like enzyme
MEVWTHHRRSFPLPPGHTFPLAKYELLAERVAADGLVRPDELHEAEPVEWEELAAVHDCGLLSRIREGCLTVREQRGLGLPWSRALVDRARRSVGGTIAAARHALGHDVALNLGGGTHHAGQDFARGYCLFNDVAVALAGLRRDGLADRAIVVDCDVHQGDGTAQIFAADERTFTLSLHGSRNYPFDRIPSDLDVDIASGTGDARYARALAEALDFALDRSRPDFAFYLAGADPFEDDRLGRLALSKAGLRARDDHVLDRLLDVGAAVCVVLAGGYAHDVRDTVDINAGTAAAVSERCHATAATGDHSSIRATRPRKSLYPA